MTGASIDGATQWGPYHRPEVEGVVVDRNIAVEMRDGVRMRVDVYRPEAPGSYPALYAVSPYQKDIAGLPAYRRSCGARRVRSSGTSSRDMYMS